MNCRVIDIGNTRIKVGFFIDDKLNEVLIFSSFDQLINSIIPDETPTLIASVREENETQTFLAYFSNSYDAKKLKSPLKTAYKTTETLGVDRLANALAISYLAQGNRLVIDLGTCLKFDFVNETDIYLGGIIAPGLAMRYKAMHHFTGKLPLLQVEKVNYIIGDTTSSSMQLGGVFAMQLEINALIDYYTQKFPDLTIFVTGGDTKHFDFSSKNYIFANENLTLFGLYKLLLANV